MATERVIESVDRALRIVEYLATSTPAGVPLAQLAADMNLNKATAHHTLSTLKSRAWVEQDPDTGAYRLGEGVSPITEYFTSAERLSTLLHPVLIAIMNSCNELVHMGTLVERDIRYLDKVEPNRAIRVVSYIGRETPAAVTALGRALIAARTEEMGSERHEVARWYTGRVNSAAADATEHQHIQERLEHYMDFYTSHGYTEEIGENEPGIACVAVPLFISGKARAAISVTAPIERMDDARRLRIAHTIAREASALGAAVSIPRQWEGNL